MMCGGVVSGGQPERAAEGQPEATTGRPGVIPKVRVAAEPADNAPTLAQLVANAEVSGKPWIDDQTPEGHFGITVKNIGGVGCYWLKGDLGDPDARVVARTQNGHHYVGGGFLGGEWVTR